MRMGVVKTDLSGVLIEQQEPLLHIEDPNPLADSGAGKVVFQAFAFLQGAENLWGKPGPIVGNMDHEIGAGRQFFLFRQHLEMGYAVHVYRIFYGVFYKGLDGEGRDLDTI